MVPGAIAAKIHHSAGLPFLITSCVFTVDRRPGRDGRGATSQHNREIAMSSHIRDTGVAPALPTAVMASPRPRRYAPRSQVMSPSRGSDPDSRGKRPRLRGHGPATRRPVGACRRHLMKRSRCNESNRLARSVSSRSWNRRSRPAHKPRRDHRLRRRHEGVGVRALRAWRRCRPTSLGGPSSALPQRSG